VGSRPSKPDAFLIEEHRGIIGQLEATLSSLGYAAHVFDGMHSFAAHPGPATPALVLIGLDQNVASHLAHARLVHNVFPAVILIGYASNYTADTLAEAMSAGVRRVLPFPVGAASLRRAVMDVRLELRLLTAHLDPGGNGTPGQPSEDPRLDIQHQLVAISSPKGGVGSSSLAVNLAVALQLLGYPTALVDGNFNFASHNVFLDLQPLRSISGLVAAADGPTTEAVSDALMQHQSGIHVLLAPEQPEDADMILYEHVQRILSILRAQFTCTVIDACPSFDGRILAALEMADTVLVPVSPDLPAMKNVSSYMRVMDLLRYDLKKFSLVLMRSDTVSPRELKEIERVLSQEIKLHVISDGARTTNAANTGMPFVLTSPDAEVSQNVFALARHLAVGAPVDSPEPTPRKQSTVERLFKL